MPATSWTAGARRCEPGEDPPRLQIGRRADSAVCFSVPGMSAMVRAAWSAAGARIVVLSTTGPEQVRALAAELASDGIPVVDAPVSGGVTGARDATLSIMVGGAKEDVDAVRGVLEDLGRTVLRLGPPGSGATAKLCNQIVVAGTLASLGEALALARRSDLDIEALLALFEAAVGEGHGQEDHAAVQEMFLDR